jgi:hypothetical protein
VLNEVARLRGVAGDVSSFFLARDSNDADDDDDGGSGEEEEEGKEDVDDEASAAAAGAVVGAHGRGSDSGYGGGKSARSRRLTMGEDEDGMSASHFLVLEAFLAALCPDKQFPDPPSLDELGDMGLAISATPGVKLRAMRKRVEALDPDERERRRALLRSRRQAVLAAVDRLLSLPAREVGEAMRLAEGASGSLPQHTRRALLLSTTHPAWPRAQGASWRVLRGSRWLVLDLVAMWVEAMGALGAWHQLQRAASAPRWQVERGLGVAPSLAALVPSLRDGPGGSGGGEGWRWVGGGLLARRVGSVERSVLAIRDAAFSALLGWKLQAGHDPFGRRTRRSSALARTLDLPTDALLLLLRFQRKLTVHDAERLLHPERERNRLRDQREKERNRATELDRKMEGEGEGGGSSGRGSGGGEM